MNADNHKHTLAIMVEIARTVNEFKSEQVQIAAFHVLTEALLGPSQNTKSAKPIAPQHTREAPAKRDAAKSAEEDKSNSKSARKRSSATYSMIGDLDLFPKGHQSIRDFMDEKNPKSDTERVVCITHYLKTVTGVGTVTANHINTAYKQLGLPVPNIKSAVNNALTRKGWVNGTSMADIALTRAGENFVEHDLPSKPTKAAKG